jgi:hypothetical protein
VAAPVYFAAGGVMSFFFGSCSRTTLPGYRLATLAAVDSYCEENTIFSFVFCVFGSVTVVTTSNRFLFWQAHGMRMQLI